MLVLQQNGPKADANFVTTFNTSTNQISAGGYAFDAAGNLTRDPAHTYQYDAEGNLLSVDGGNTGSYMFDAFNRRVQQQPVSASGIMPQL